MPTIDNLHAIFEQELKDIYDAEKRLTKALPKLAKASASPELRAAFEEHLEVTKTQIENLDQMFNSIGKKPAAKTCAGMKGLVEEGDEAMSNEGSEPYGDIGLVSAARRVEHYEMAAYLSLRAVAEGIPDLDVLALIDENLQGEQEADEKLAEIGSQLVQSVTASEEEAQSSTNREKTPTKKLARHA